MRRSVTTSCILAGASIATVLLAGCSSSSSSVTGQQLVGAWTGTNSGYEGEDSYVTQDTRIVIAAANGRSFVGYKEWREADGSTGSQPLKGVVTAEGRIFIVEADSVIEGTVSGSDFTGVYVEMGEDHAAFAVELTKE